MTSQGQEMNRLPSHILILRGTGILESRLWEEGGHSENPSAVPSHSTKGVHGLPKTSGGASDTPWPPRPPAKVTSASVCHYTPFFTSRRAHGHSVYPAPQDTLEEQYHRSPQHTPLFLCISSGITYFPPTETSHG